jgi:nitrite reductase (NADH) small subunit
MTAATLACPTDVTWAPLCALADLVAHSGVVAWHQGQQVALFYLPGQAPELYAIDNRDPRSGANVIGRGIIGNLGGQPVVAAPLYKQHFSLADGHCLEDPGQALRTWPVRLVGGQVEIGR